MLIKNNGEKPDLLTRIMNFLFGKFFKIFNRSFDWVSEKYGKAVHGIVRHWVLVIFTYVILLGLTGYLFSITPSGFIPKQDNDFLQISVQMPDGYSLGQTDKVMKHVQFVGGRSWNHLDLDLFGRIQSMVVKERALVQASYNLYCNLMLSIHARIASEYFFARQCESEIKLLSDTLKVRKIQTEFVQKRLSLKFASKLDLSRAKVLEYEAAS